MGERNTSKHAGYRAGLALRVAELRERFPDVLVSCDVHDEFPGPDLICWNADPEEIWVWFFESDDSESLARDRLRGFLAHPAEVTDVVAKRVVAGPNAVFPTASIRAASPLDSRERVEVLHGAVDGIQLYREFGVEGKTPLAERTAVVEALEAASDADHDSRESLGFRREDETAMEPAPAPAPVGKSTWRRPETVQLQLTIDLSEGTDDRLIRDWFESAWSLFREVLPPDIFASAAETERQSGAIRFGAVDGADEDRSWQLPFDDENWASFLSELGRRSAELQYLTVELAEDERYPWLTSDGSALAVDFWRYPVGGGTFGVLGIEMPRAVFSRAAEAGVVLLRRTANRGALFGLIGIDYGVQLMTGLEYALYLHPWETVRSVRHTLRGYSWITILSEPQTERVGGVAQLRGSGAFVRVEPLAGGGCWLQATDTFDGYGDAEAARVYQVLRPLLPGDAFPSTFKNEWRDV